MSAPTRADGTGQRERVFAEAMRSIAELGPERTTMRVLSARLGMSPGHILYYFGSKDRLLLETLQWSEDDLMRRELAKVARARSNAAKVRKIVEGYTPRSSRDPRWLLWAYTYAQPPRDQGGLAAVQEISRPWYDTLWEVLAYGVEAGDFRPLEPEREALRACALMDGLAMTVLLGVRGFGRDWAIAEALDYMNGATTKKGRKAHA